MTPASRQLRVLLIEDNDDDERMILDALARDGLSILSRRVQEQDALLEAITAEPWDVVLTDHVLPGFDSTHGIDALTAAEIDAPCIVVSGRIGEDAVAAALRAGAADYVSKDHLDELGGAILSSLARQEGVRRRRRDSEELARREARVAEIEADADSSGVLTPVPRAVARLPLIAAAVSGALGVLVLFGWAIGSRTLTGVVPSLPTMKADTALAFVLSGAALALAQRTERWAPRLGHACSGVLVVLGLLVLLEWTTRLRLGIDQLLVHDPTHGAGRPAPHTAAAFLLFGLVQLTLDSRRQGVRVVHQVLGIAFALTVVSAALGYLYGSDILTGGHSRFTGMAVTTMAGLLVLLCGAMAQRPDRDPLRRLRGGGQAAVMLRHLAPAVLLVPPLLGALWNTGNRAGWYDGAFGLALFTLSMLVAFGVVVGVTAAGLDRGNRERLLAAAALRHSERRFRELTELAPVGIFESATGGACLYVNERWCEITGCSEEAALADGLEQAIHPEDRAAVTAARASAAHGRTPAAIEYRCLRPDGTIVWVIGRFAPVHRGSTLTVLGTISDVTARRRAEQQARESEARLQSLLDHAPMPMSLRDLDGRLVLVNQVAAEVMGCTVQEALGRPVEELYDPAATAGLDAQERPVRDGEGAVTFEFSATGSDGVRRDYFVTKYPVTDGAGTIVGVGGISLDVTGRRAAEQALARTEERLRQLLEAAPDAMVVADEGGTIQTVNAQTENLLGYSRDELVGHSIEMLLPDAVRGRHAARREGFAAAPTARHMGAGLDLHARHKSGAEIPVEISLSPVHTHDGLLVTAAIRDVTQRRLEQMRVLAAEERFRMTIDHAPIGIMLASPEGRIMRVNRALCDMTGYAEGELLSKRLQDITHPDDLDADRELLAGLDTGASESYEVEKRLYRADGSTLWVGLSVSLVRDAGGRPMHFVTQVQDITERRRHEHELRHMADHDPLTGLMNRRALGAAVAAQLSRQARYGGRIAMLVLDLDHFKYINDTLGHRVGDQVVCAVADALRGRLRETDIVARLGGDEFAVLLPEVTHEAAETIAAELVTTISELRIGTPDRELTVSASVGVVVVAASDEYDQDTLLAAADLAMYEAKDAGRDRHAVYEQGNEGHVRASAGLDWSQRIRTALERDQFVLHYQPIVHLADRAGGRYEALIRLPGEDGELVPPNTFLPIAERYGLMPAIDRWVVRNVILTLAAGTLPADAIVALNLSARSLTDDALLDVTEALLAEHHIDPARLIFEVTESAAITQLDRAQQFGRRLQELGCGFALDDFGTGFGSFSHLKHLPYGYIKIDGEFVRGMREDPDDRLLVEALVRIAQGTGKKTVAEFVGDEETVQLLRELGVDYGQGFHLGRPGPVGALTRAAGAPATQQ